MKSGIYKITSLSHPDRIYVGSAVDLRKRQQQHWNQFRRGKHINYLLLGHIKKYSISDLKFEIIERCPVESLLMREQFFIDSLQPSFNICKKAGNTLGRKWTEAARNKRELKNRNRGWKMSSEIRHQMHLGRIKPPKNKINSYILLACGLFGEGISRKKKNHYQCENCGKTRSCTEREIKKRECLCQRPPVRIKKAKVKTTIPNGYNILRKDNTSGYPSVVWDPKVNKWRARIKHKGKLLDAGRFQTKEKAHYARQQKLVEMNVPIRPWRY